MLSAIIFDLDGVLADSELWWSKIDAELLAEYGVTYRGEYHQNVVGVSYRLAVEFYKKTFGLSAPNEEMMRRRGEIATEFFATRVGLFSRVKEVVQELLKRLTTANPLPTSSSARRTNLEFPATHALWSRTRFPASTRPGRRRCASPRFPTGGLLILPNTKRKPTTFSMV